MMTIEVMKQCLEALENYVDVVVSVNDPNDWRTVADGGKPARKSITSLRQAIAEAEKQEPVAWLQIGLAPLHEGDVIARTTKPTKWNPEWWRFEPLYTTPPQRKPLTDEQIADLYFDKFSMGELKAFARAIEAAHGIKE